MPFHTKAMKSTVNKKDIYSDNLSQVYAISRCHYVHSVAEDLGDGTAMDFGKM
jgi:hypothetical protein